MRGRASFTATRSRFCHLSRDGFLADVIARAQAIVQRTKELTLYCERVVLYSKEEATKYAECRRYLLVTKNKPQRCGCNLGRGLANLVELDETAADALFTLDVVKGAET